MSDAIDPGADQEAAEARAAAFREAIEAIRAHVQEFVDQMSARQRERLEASRRDGYQRLWEAVQSETPWEDPESELLEVEAEEEGARSVHVDLDITLAIGIHGTIGRSYFRGDGDTSEEDD